MVVVVVVAVDDVLLAGFIFKAAEVERVDGMDRSEGTIVLAKEEEEAMVVVMAVVAVAGR